MEILPCIEGRWHVYVAQLWQFREEDNTKGKESTKTKNDSALRDSIRNNADVNGTTLGIESNTSKFSDLGKKNKARKEEDGVSNAG